MRNRAELLVGRRVRAMWVMTFHSACARMLRAHADKLGYTRQFTIYDTGRLAAPDQALHGGERGRPQALHARRDPQPDLRRQEPHARRRGVLADGRARSSSGPSPTSTRSYERELHRMNAMDFDDLLVRAVNVLELFPEVRDDLPGGVPADPRRRVPGHQPGPVPLAAAARRRAPQPDRRRRPGSVDLRLPRRRHPQHPQLRGAVPGREGRQARAELPLDADDPRRRQRGDRPQPRAQGEGAVDRPRRRATRSTSASSTTSTPRRGSSPARSSGWSTAAPRAARSPSSTGPTRSRACSRTRSCAPRSATR